MNRHRTLPLRSLFVVCWVICALTPHAFGRAPPVLDQQHSAGLSITGKTPKNMVFIPPGTFRMGSPASEADRYPDEGPQTAVTISHALWMGKYEVTQAEYLAVMGKNPSRFTGDPNRPVDSVTWSDAANYCAKLTERERAAGQIPANVAYRLPTEAEWEYACRAGTTTRFSYGDDPDYTNLTKYAWYRQNAGFVTHAVGQKLPSPWGLYDMYGNVWEWCQDWYGAYPGGTAFDPSGPAKPGMKRQRTMRGGDYFNPARHCRSALRGFDFVPKHPWPPDFGFRVVLAPDQPSACDRPGQSYTRGDTRAAVTTSEGVDSAAIAGSSVTAKASPAQTRTADPVAAVYERMTPGVQVGHFDHDQDRAPSAEVNSEYLDAVKAAGFKSIRFFHSTNQGPAFYAPNVSYALKQGLVVNLCAFVWNSIKTKEEYAAYWKVVAEYYKEYPEELVFEMFNEPALSPKLTDSAAVMEWINAAIVAVRAVSPKRILKAGNHRPSRKP